MSSSPADSARRRGLLFIVSAPSGTGKTTLVERLVQRIPNLRMSRSYTSRRRAPVSRTALTIISSAASGFEDDGRRGRVSRVGGRLRQLLRHVRRPTPKRCLAGGQDLVLVIDVQGARQVRSSGIESIGDLRAAAVGRGARAAAARPQQGHRRRRFRSGSRSARREVGEFAHLRVRRGQRRARRGRRSAARRSCWPSARCVKVMRATAETIIETFQQAAGVIELGNW